MVHSDQEMLEILRFELKFLEDGGYGRSPRTPWRPPFMFTDSPTCLNFNDSSRPHSCSQCSLQRYVPEGQVDQSTQCWSIPVGAKGESVEDLYRWGTQLEIEEALKAWLRREIGRLEAALIASASVEQVQASA
jgi:hypothetical protein